MEDPTDESSSTPGEVFSRVANETRFEILEALWNAEEDGLSFSELHELVDMRDSGQFNYHLGKLVDVFLRKEDEQYHLRYAGMQLIGAVLAGIYTRELTIEEIDIGEVCNFCGGDLTGSYDAEELRVRCTACDAVITEIHVPPGVLDPYEGESLASILDQWLKLSLDRMTTGFCPLCFGPFEMSISEMDSEYVEHLGVEFECSRCGYSIGSLIGSAVLRHPAVVAFHYVHGIDLETTPLWGLEWLFEDHAHYVDDTEELAEIVIEIDGDTLRLVVDRDLDVVSVEGSGIVAEAA